MSFRTSLRIVLSTLLLIAVLSVAFAQQPLFRFVQFSDTQPAVEEHWTNAARAVEVINGLCPAFVLIAGDLTDAGSSVDSARMLKIFTNLKAPWYAIPGNHDVLNRTAEDSNIADILSLHTRRYERYFGTEPWSMTYGNFKFLGVNTCAPYFSDGSNPGFVEWLDRELADPSTPNRFIVGHYTYASVAPWLQKLFDKYQVAGYLHGHDHAFYHRYPEGSNTLDASSWAVVSAGGFLCVDVYTTEAKLSKCDLQGNIEETGTMALAAEAKLPGPTSMKP